MSMRDCEVLWLLLEDANSRYSYQFTFRLAYNFLLTTVMVEMAGTKQYQLFCQVPN